MQHYRRKGGARRHASAVVEPIEPRRLLAADVGFDLQPIPSYAAEPGQSRIDLGTGRPGRTAGAAFGAGGGGGGHALLGDGAAAITESEPNNTRGTADGVPLGPDGALVTGTITWGDIDYFGFTLAQKSGLFIDIDAAGTGLSGLDSRVQVFNASGVLIDQNASGFDFEGFTLNETSATPASVDPSLYVDLAAGSYFIAVIGESGSTGAYELKLAYETDYVTSVPVFNSLPGASKTLYLDFDGHSSSTDAWASNYGAYTLPAYDFDGNFGVYSPGEQMGIENIWRVTAEDFAPFNINVTTVQPPVLADGVAMRIAVGGHNADVGRSGGAVGVAYMNSWSDHGIRYKTAFSFAAGWMGNGNFAPYGTSGYIVGAANETGNTASHEAGHAMGLAHYVNESSYRGGLLYTPDYGLNRERWISGTNSSGNSQNDVNVIRRSSNQITYRPDDHGQSLGSATELTTDPTGNYTYAADGLIHVSSDVDWFRFDAAGDTTVILDISEFYGNLDANLDIYNASGSVIASATTSRLGEEIHLADLAAGTYFARVSSRGRLGDIGNYRLGVVTQTDTQPPAVVGAQFAWQSAQQVIFTFDEAIDPATLSPGDLNLVNHTTGQVVPTGHVAVSYDAGAHTATFTFPGFVNGILPDGNYTAALGAGSVSDPAGNATGADASVDFFVLAGDTDRDRDVDFFDFLTLRSNYGRSGMLFSDGDLNYSGTVDFFDFLILRGNYNAFLPPPPAGGSLFSDGGIDDGGLGRTPPPSPGGRIL